MQLAVLPNITGKNKRAVATDELPQSGGGKTVTTTEPKFVPSESAVVKTASGTKARVRLIDCVGYMVNGAVGHEEEGKPRMVKTPWSEQPVPFEEAAEIGTRKVICDHSTVAVVVTCDGSFTDIPRESYEKAEERVIKELKQIGKPFITVLNTVNPDSEESKALEEKLNKKYDCGVICKNLQNLTEEDIGEILSGVLMQFPVQTVSVVLPDWMRTLSADNGAIAPLLTALREVLPKIKRMKDCHLIESAIEKLNYVLAISCEIDSGEGRVKIAVTPKEDLYYLQLSLLTGEQIEGEYSLMRFVQGASRAKKQYEKIKGALAEAEQTGYGIVSPCEDEISLAEPEMVKSGNSYGVKIKATAPSLHIVRVQIGAEVNSVVGKERQCNDYVQMLKRQYEENPQGIMQVDLFGRPIYSFVSEEIFDKAGGMKSAFREKICRTVEKIVNEKKNALFCITV